MRRPHRNIEIFSMSVLDMFASALGAFIMCSVILFPYYKKDVSQELSKAKETLQLRTTELDTTRREAREVQEQIRKQDDALRQQHETQARLNVCKQGLNQCQVALAKNFALVQIEWDKEINVDLHVTDPSGNEFYWRKTNRCQCDYTGTKARLSVDSFGSSHGGIEIWLDPELRPGSYIVEYAIDRPGAQETKVTGVVIDRLGSHALPVQTMRGQAGSAGELKVRAAEIRVGGDGALSIQ